MILGTTYSRIQTKYLKLEHYDIFTLLLDFGFDVIRIGCYWDEIQPEKNTYNFASITHLLDECEKKKQNAVVTIGIKAPRWPEYYFPPWLVDKSIESCSDYIYTYIGKTVQELKNYQCIKYWQVENEPLDPSGPENISIPFNILKQELELVKSIDTSRPIIITLWGNELTKRNLLRLVSPLADIIGLDIYYKTPVNRFFYQGPSDSLKSLKTIITNLNKHVWITELQAEPWEWNKLITKDRSPRSMNKDILSDNYRKTVSLDPQAIFLWGFEYWYWKKIKGDPEMWNTAKKIAESPRPAASTAASIRNSF